MGGLIRPVTETFRFNSGIVSLGLEDLSQEDAGSSFPTSDQTLRGQLAFIAWHECYHVGQIGLLRTEMGYSSLRQRLYAARRSAGG